MRMPKLQEIYTIDAIVCHRYERMFSQLFCFERENTLKDFSNKLYSSKINKEKKKHRRKQSVWDLKNA